MSRFVEVALEFGALDEVAEALASLGIAFERADEPLLLRGGIECGDAPVDLRVVAAVCDCVEDFGFVADARGVAVLVCGEPDRTRLMQTLVPPILAAIVRARVQADPTLEVEAAQTRADGSIRLRVRSR